MARTLLPSVLIAALLLAPSVAAEPDPLDPEECIGSGHWTTFPERAAGCVEGCIGSGHWTTFADRVLTCLLG